MSDATRRYDRVVFVDRDGVINVPAPVGDYVLRWEEFAFADGALEALRRLRDHGFTVVIITNQSCVGRGLTTLENIQGINARMLEAIAAAGGAVAELCLCPHAPDEGCSCRKPKPGMIQQAARELGLRPDRAFLVGDSESDIQAGVAMGCTTFLVDNWGDGRADVTLADGVVASLAEAVERILQLLGGQESAQGTGPSAGR